MHLPAVILLTLSSAIPFGDINTFLTRGNLIHKVLMCNKTFEAITQGTGNFISYILGANILVPLLIEYLKQYSNSAYSVWFRLSRVTN